MDKDRYFISYYNSNVLKSEINKDIIISLINIIYKDCREDSDPARLYTDSIDDAIDFFDHIDNKTFNKSNNEIATIFYIYDIITGIILKYKIL